MPHTQARPTSMSYADFAEIIAGLAIEGPSVDIIDRELELYRCKHCGAELRTRKKVGHAEGCLWVKANNYLNGG